MCDDPRPTVHFLQSQELPVCPGSRVLCFLSTSAAAPSHLPVVSSHHPGGQHVPGASEGHRPSPLPHAPRCPIRAAGLGRVRAQWVWECSFLTQIGFLCTFPEVFQRRRLGFKRQASQSLNAWRHMYPGLQSHHEFPYLPLAMSSS